MTNRRVIGFDREIRAEWLDAVAAKVADGESPAAVRKWLNKFLRDRIGVEGSVCNRSKIITVLCRIWSNVPKPCQNIRNRALSLIQQVDPEERLAIHWSIASAVYPFFGDVTSSVGRLLALQGDVQRQTVMKRMAESWGDRSSVNRACRAIWNSLSYWGVMNRTDYRGRYIPLERKHPISMATTGLLVEASIISNGSRPIPLKAMRSWPGLFPFDLSDVAVSSQESGHIMVSRTGSELELLQIIPEHEHLKSALHPD